MAIYTSSYTGAQIDAAVAQTSTNKTDIATLKSDIGIVGRYNYLDNSHFQINQRNASTVTSGYGIDRWFLVGGTNYTANSDGTITITQGLMSQYLAEQLPNDTYTAGVLLSDNSTVKYGSAEKTDDTSTLDLRVDSDIRIDYEPSILRFDLNTVEKSTLTIKAVGLFRGTITENEIRLTLQNRPNVAEERLRCVSSTADSTDTYANNPYVVEDLSSKVEAVSSNVTLGNKRVYRMGKMIFIYVDFACTDTAASTILFRIKIGSAANNPLFTPVFCNYGTNNVLGDLYLSNGSNGYFNFSISPNKTLTANNYCYISTWVYID